MNRIYFNQADPRWASYPYPSPTKPGATIKSGGCGATTAAMIVSSFVSTIYPNQMGDIFRKNGFRVNGGTSETAFCWIAKNWGLKCRVTSYIADCVNYVKNGGMAICHCYDDNYDLFSTGGHYIVISEVRDSKLVVFDPYLYKNKFSSGIRKKVKVQGHECIITINDFKKYIKNYKFWCYENPNKKELSKYEEGKDCEIHVPIADTGVRQGNSQIGGEDMLVDSHLFENEKDQFWIHTSVVKNDEIIARAKICFASGRSYMVQVFNRQFWITENCIKKIF